MKKRFLVVAGLMGALVAWTKWKARKNTEEISVLLPYRFASKEEGRDLLLSNKAYHSRFTKNDLEFRMQTKDTDLEAYKEFAGAQVLDFTEEEKGLINEYIGIIRRKILDRGYKLSPTDPIVFITTTMQEENDVGAYTHGNQIYYSDSYMKEVLEREEYEDQMEYLLTHEIFHCLTRANPDFRRAMYEIIHFTIQEEDFPLPPSVQEYYISNPDVEHHNSYGTFDIQGRKVECFTAFVTRKHFEEAGERFFDFGETALVPIDGRDIYYRPEDASNFDDVFGRNTSYVIDPEECLADNFSYLLTYGKEGIMGAPYPNPEIIEAIDEYLRKDPTDR